MSAVPGKTPGLAAHAFERYADTLLKVIFGGACVFYAVLAFDYFLGFGAGRESLWMRLFATLVSREHAFGAGSVHVEQALAYRDGLSFLLMHTTMGAIAMAIGPFQFSARLRARYPLWHRNAGKTYLLAVVLSMIGGLAYLYTTPPQGVFSGAVFAVALVGLDLMVLFTAWLAYAAVRRRAYIEHRTWMAFNFGLLLATPVLRLLWIVFAWAFPDRVQTATNLAITTFLLPLCVTGMLWWATWQNRAARPRPLSRNATAARRWRYAGRCALLAGFVALVVLNGGHGAADATWFASAGWSRLVYVAVSATALTTSLAAIAAAVAGRPAGRAFHAACLATALSGVLAAVASGARLPGGWPLLCYWWALAGLWWFATGFAWHATRAGYLLVARDWTLYSAGLAWLPLTVAVQLPLWARVEVMTADSALQTAVTLSFIGHYLIVQVVIARVLDRPRTPARGHP